MKSYKVSNEENKIEKEAQKNMEKEQEENEKNKGKENDEIHWNPDLGK